MGLRILLGLIFTIFGLNGFFMFLPMPAPSPEAGAFFGALVATKYFFPVLKTIEICCGLLLLSGYFVPLAITILAPITIHIFLFHLFLDQSGLVLGIAVVVLDAYLAYTYRDSFASVLTAKSEPKN